MTLDLIKNIWALQKIFFFEEAGSKQQNTWGINIYPEETGEKFIEFDSMINLKPNQGNRTRNIDNPDIRNKIVEIVNKLILPMRSSVSPIDTICQPSVFMEVLLKNNGKESYQNLEGASRSRL